jgi:hypothetical protein
MKKKSPRKKPILLMEDVVLFETSKLAKKAGFVFNGRTNDWMQTTLPYNEDGTRDIQLRGSKELFPAPTQGLLQKWLRERHHIQVEVNFRKFGVKDCDGYYYMCATTKYHSMSAYYGKYKTYEEALEAGLLCGLESIKYKDK